MGDEVKKKCTGCSVISGELVPIGGYIYETKSFVLAQDAEVPLKGFMIIQSKKHTNSLLGFEKEEIEELSELIYKTRKAMKDLKISDEVTIVQEERSRHFHIWIFPHCKWMEEKFGKGIKYLRDINEYIIENATDKDKQEVLETVEMLKKYFAK